MAEVLVKIKIMPESPEIDLDKVKEEINGMVEKFDAKLMQSNIEPIAFGLKAMNITLLWKEDRGSTDELEKKILGITGVQSVEVTDVRRAIG